jgi:hypothetical protein
VCDCKKEIEEYVKKSGIKEQTVETTWMNIKQSTCKAAEKAL